MEKILIVRRRKQTTQRIDTESMTGPPPDFETNRSTGMYSNDESTKHHENRDTIAVSDNSDVNSMMSIPLTQEQSELVRSNADFEFLRDDLPGDIKVDVERTEGGKFIFHFHVQKFQGMRMLKVDEVCRMLQISKSFLMTLVREKQLKSYKIGRLRRFSLEDVLEYLARSEEMV